MSNCRQHQQQQRRGWNVWGVISDNARVVTIAKDSRSNAHVCIEKYKNSDQQSPIVACSLLRWTIAVLCCMNKWSISVQSCTVWRPLKLPPFARVNPSVRTVCLSVTIRSTAKTAREAYGYYGEHIGSHRRATQFQGPHFQPPRPPHLPNWGS